MSQVRIAEIIVDETLYPRHKISEGNILQLKEALRAGATLPPVVLDRETKKVIDGWHRVEAIRRLRGEGATIEAELRRYNTAQEMFRDAVALNNSQGLKLTTWDRVRSIIRMRELGASEEVVAQALSLTPDKVRKLMERTAETSSGEQVSLKGSMKQFSGQTITEEQKEYNEGSAPGLSILALLTQIVRALEADVVDLSNERVAAQFARIHELVEGAAI